jgi:hypothetical protein
MSYKLVKVPNSQIVANMSKICNHFLHLRGAGCLNTTGDRLNVCNLFHTGIKRGCIMWPRKESIKSDYLLITLLKQ